MTKDGRLYFLDNIRWSMILLVLLVHSAVTYGPIGSWFYHDTMALDTVSEVVLIVIPTYAQTFFMGLLFFVAGYLVPGSLERKGARKFMADRAVRLGVPSLLFMLVLAPVILLMLFGGSALDRLPSYFVTPLAWESGPLWFALALLGFTVAYALWVKLSAGPVLFRAIPSNSTVLALIVTIIVVTFTTRVFYPIGTSIWNMQLCFFPQYVAMFLLGIGAYRGEWLMTLSGATARLWLGIALVLGILIFPILFVVGGALDGNFNAFAGGLTWQALALVVVEEFMGVGISIGMLVWFRERHNSNGRVDKVLADNSFAIYVLHAPILVAMALLLSSTSLPVLARFVLVFVLGLAITLGLSMVIRKVPLLRKVL